VTLPQVGRLQLLNVLFPLTSRTEFTEHQRSVFCVFSGQGVVGLRKYLNQEHAFANSLPPPPPPHRARPNGDAADNAGLVNAQAAPHAHNADGAFDDAEPDAVDDEDVLGDGSEMIIDTQPLLQNVQGASTAPLGGNPVFTAAPPHPQPVSAQAQSMAPMFNYVGGHPPYVPQQVRFDESSTASSQANGSPGVGGSDPMELSSPYPSASGSASAGPANSSSHAHPNGGSQAPVNGTGPTTTGAGAGSATNQARPEREG
jgi:F-box and leucine-rich repeat protein GRR1